MNEKKSLLDSTIEILKSANERELDLILRFVEALLKK